MYKHLDDDRYLDITVPKYEMSLLREEIFGDQIHEDFRHKLAGNQSEGKLLSWYCHEQLGKYLCHHAKEFKGMKYELDSLWFNVSHAGDFNPPHQHGGDISFVIFVQIPYTMIDQVDKYHASGGNLAGHFSFYYNDIFGSQCDLPIPVDVTYENTMFMFPAKLQHGVYPFHGTESPRITVSGNLHRSGKVKKT
jgi:hypothetical protein